MSSFSSTAAEAYYHIVASGLLPLLRMKVYRYVFKNQDRPELHGGPSRANVKAHYGDRSDTYVPRIAELIRHGVLYYAGKKLNDAENTGKQVGYLRVTKRNTPLPLPPRPKFHILVLLKGEETLDCQFICGYRDVKKILVAGEKWVNDGTSVDQLVVLRVNPKNRVDVVPLTQVREEALAEQQLIDKLEAGEPI